MPGKIVRRLRRDWGLSIKAVVAEFMAMTLFVFIGTGTATTFSSVNGPSGFQLAPQSKDITYLAENIRTNGCWGVITALAFGLAITVMAFATAHLSGGQINPSVTLGLALVGAISPVQAAANMCAQIVGAILGSSLLFATIPDSSNSTLGSNMIAPGVGVGNALCGEIVMTFVLVSVVLETAVNKKSVARAQAPLAIGFAVFTAHAVLLPLDGCSINPARSLGPAIVSGTWPGTFWVFIVGPFTGAICAVPFHLFYRSDFDTMKSPDPVNLEALSSTTGPTDIVAEGNPDNNRGPGMADGGRLRGGPTPKVSLDSEMPGMAQV